MPATRVRRPASGGVREFRTQIAEALKLGSATSPLQRLGEAPALLDQRVH